MRFLVIGYVAKEGGREFSSVKGYKLTLDDPVPSYHEIRRSCLEWANSDGDNFAYFSITFMQFMSEIDYNSFMAIE